MKLINDGELSRAVEESIARDGVTPEAVWPDKNDALSNGIRRCEAVFRMIDAGRRFSILDVGCGPGFVIDFLNDIGRAPSCRAGAEYTKLRTAG
jgi:hypothetical protein